MTATLHYRDQTQDLHILEDTFLANDYCLFPELPADGVVYDLGAHIGAFAMLCLARGALKVICVEANPENCELLERNLEPWKGRYEIHQKALWSPQDKGSTLFLSRRDDQNTAMGSVAEEPPVFDCRAWAVPALALDDLLQPHDGPVLVKLDIEGAEYPAVYASHNITDADQIIVETHITRNPAISDDWRRIPTPHSHAGMATHLASLAHHVECREGSSRGETGHALNNILWTHARFTRPLFAWPRKV